MGGFLKRTGILLLISAVMISYTFNVGAISDNGVWEDSKLCVFLEADGESNSDLCFAAVKVKYDRSIHRVYLLFMLEFDDFNDDLNSGVIMNFNGMGEVTVMSDGTAEYNDNIYYAELDDELADKNSKNVLLETTVGIKSGIPDNLVMDVRVIDTNGVKSNTYSVDISEETEEETEPDGEADSTEKTGRTTKAKTTKVKTTKPKTTKVKTTRSKKSTTQNDDAEDEEPQTVINTYSGEAVTPDNGRKRLTLALGSAAAVIAVAAGCAAGIKNRKKDESKKEK